MAARDSSFVPAIQFYEFNAGNGRRRRPGLWGDADELKPELAAAALRTLADVIDGQTCHVEVGIADNGALRIGIRPCGAGVPAGAVVAALLGLSAGGNVLAR